MKSVLISIKPKWCELIANGKKRFSVGRGLQGAHIPNSTCFIIYRTAVAETDLKPQILKGRA